MSTNCSQQRSSLQLTCPLPQTFAALRVRNKHIPRPAVKIVHFKKMCADVKYFLFPFSERF